MTAAERWPNLVAGCRERGAPELERALDELLELLGEDLHRGPAKDAGVLLVGPTPLDG